jgi:23S rRNA (cytosine1962-C5)-methyltransferase
MILDNITPILTQLDERKLEQDFRQRVFHGRGHTYIDLDFITVDWYPPALFVCVFHAVDSEWLDSLVSRLWDSKQAVVSAIVVQHRQGSGTKSEVIYGELPETQVIAEKPAAADLDPLRCYVQLAHSQNVGIFADMINGRNWVRGHSEGKNVLNLFAYTCLFSVAALQGGATSVVNVDMNKSVIATGRKNHQLNGLTDGRAKFFAHNIFNSWGKIKRYGRYDLIIIDPPSFQQGSFVLTKDYEKLIKRLPDLAGENAQVMLCVNSPDVACQFIFDLVALHCPQMTFIKRLENHPDFPEIDAQKSLKVLLFKF